MKMQFFMTGLCLALNSFEIKLLDEINQYRTSLHIPSLRVNESLSRAARKRIQTIERNQEDFNDFEWRQVLNDSGYVSKDYSVISGYRMYPTRPSIVEAIKSSANHIAVLNGKYSCIGVGKKRIGTIQYFSLLFGECDDLSSGIQLSNVQSPTLKERTPITLLHTATNAQNRAKNTIVFDTVEPLRGKTILLPVVADSGKKRVLLVHINPEKSTIKI